MDKSKITIDIDEVMKDDELEARQQAAKSNKRNLMRRKKRLKIALIITCIIIFSIYLISDLSNVRVIDINGNKVYTKEDILSISKLDYASKSILVPGFLMELRLNKDPLIKKANVHKTWDGIVRIDIEEENMIGYYVKDKKNYLMFKEGDDLLVEDNDILVHVPYLNDLNDKQKEEFKKNIKNVKKENIWLISEIAHYETTYDKNMLRLYMQDGHVVITTMNGLKMLNNYLEMLTSLNTTHKCITFVEETNSSYSEKCE